MSSRLRALFLMQQVLGHATHSASIERVARDDADLDARWVPISFYRPGGLIERMPLPPGVRGVCRAASEVQAALLRHRPQAVLFNSPALAVPVLPWLGRLPAVITLDITPRQFDREGAYFGHTPDSPGLAAAAKHLVNVELLRRARMLVPWSRWAAESLRGEYGVPSDRITVVPPGVDLAAWRPDPGPPDPGLPRVLFVGADFARKGGDLLLDWYRERGRELCQLIIVSSHPAALATREFGAEVHDSERPNGERLRRLYRRSDLFALPSRSEPFGIAAVEALASGLPVVATRVGGLGEIVEDQVDGLIVPAGDGRGLGAALETLLDDVALRRRLGAAGRRKAELQFDERRNGRRLLELVKETAATGGQDHRWSPAAGRGQQ